MIDTDKLEQLAKQIHNTLPQGLRDFGEDIEKKIKVILQYQLSKLDVVNREEFDQQTHVLLRCRERIKQLETRIEQLENRFASPTTVTEVIPDSPR